MDELENYQGLLTDALSDSHNSSKSRKEDMRIAPLVWWDVKENVDLKQYAVLGHDPSQSTTDHRKPVLLNTNAPWSAFLCGSQGSGKSHTLSCMLENCLLDDRKIGFNPHPLAALVFHYDRLSSSEVSEAAYLCNKVKTTVLVSASNYKRRKTQYEAMAQAHGGKIEVKKFMLETSYLNTEHIKTLMAMGKDTEIPLYMRMVMQILRELAIEKDGHVNYSDFRAKLAKPGFSQMQNQPLYMRLDLLESYINTKKTITNDLVGEEGTLTIVDLTDPVLDEETACVLFNISLSIFISKSSCGKIVALDEAHNYMLDDSAAAKQFTDSLLSTICQQRHRGVRIVIATQEPTLNTNLLELCSIAMVHRCSSPAWVEVLKKHLAGMYLASRIAGSGEDVSISQLHLFRKITQLRLGESLLFCPTAAVLMDEGNILRMADVHDKSAHYIQFRTRERLTADGGRTKTAGA